MGHILIQLLTKQFLLVCGDGCGDSEVISSLELPTEEQFKGRCYIKKTNPTIGVSLQKLEPWSTLNDLQIA